MPYEIALFDLDYTLFDSNRSEAQAIRQSLAECSIHDTPEMLATYQLINKDLWEKLDKLCEANSVSWKWVKGHSSNKFNNLADELATKAIK